MRECDALIVKEFKTALADSIRPTEPFTNPKGYPICGGKLEFYVQVIGRCCGQEECYCEDPSLEVEIFCHRCKNPYFKGIDRLYTNPTGAIEDLLNGVEDER